MEPADVERELEELESRVERLRALYEQYFMGLEKLEPQIPRKEVERRIWVLRREQIRNTGMRFKFQMLVQRFNTFQQYWGRVIREIESGTYRRDVMRAAARIGEKEAMTILGRKRAKQFATLLEAQNARKGQRPGAAAAAEETAVAAVAAAPEPAAMTGGWGEITEVMDATDTDVDDAPTPKPAAPAFKPAAPVSPTPEAPPVVVPEVKKQLGGLRWGGSPRPSARPVSVSAPPETTAVDPAPGRFGSVDPAPGRGANTLDDAPSAVREPDPKAARQRVAELAAAMQRRGAAPIQPPRVEASLDLDLDDDDTTTLAKPAPRPPPPRTPTPRRRSSRSMRAVRIEDAPVGPARPRTEVPPVPQPPAPTVEARPVRPPPAPPRPPAAPSTPTRNPWDEVTVPKVNRPTAAPAAPPPPAVSAPAAAPRAAPAQPRPAPPAPQQPTDLSDQRIRQIYAKYVETKRASNESTSGMTYERLAESLRTQAGRLRTSHPTKSVDYEVVVKDGRTMLKPILK